MTTLEYLAKHYPLHVQRIVEAMHEQDIFDNTHQELDRVSEYYSISYLFVWAYTVEGHDYWKALSQVETYHAQG